MTGKSSLELDRLAYRIQGAAKLLDVSRPMIYKMIRTGQLETVKVGTVMRVTRESIERLMQGTNDAA